MGSGENYKARKEGRKMKENFWKGSERNMKGSGNKKREGILR
jgi:hypothetical protein